MPEKVLYPSIDGLKLCAIEHTVQDARGSVVLAHGITADKDEEGVFVDLATALHDHGFNVLRFDFRAHGESEGRQEDMTMAGELRDLAASMSYAKQRWALPTALLGASFGAVSAVEYAAQNKDLPWLVLWNPVLDLYKTFLDPVVPWAKNSFNAEGYTYLERHGFLLLAEHYKLGREFIQEMRIIKPFDHLKDISCPVLTLHGDQDTHVPYSVSKEHAVCNNKSRFVTVPGAEHGFGPIEDRRFVISRTIDWIEDQMPPYH